MNEKIHKQIEMAIAHELYCAKETRSSGWPVWMKPIRIENDKVVMLWGDCGNENRPEDISIWTTDDWSEAVSPDGTGLFRRVGIWSFIPVLDPAAECIRYCHECPDAAGRELYELRMRFKLKPNQLRAGRRS